MSREIVDSIRGFAATIDNQSAGEENATIHIDTAFDAYVACIFNPTPMFENAVVQPLVAALDKPKLLPVCSQLSAHTFILVFFTLYCTRDDMSTQRGLCLLVESLQHDRHLCDTVNERPDAQCNPMMARNPQERCDAIEEKHLEIGQRILYICLMGFMNIRSEVCVGTKKWVRDFPTTLLVRSLTKAAFQFGIMVLELLKGWPENHKRLPQLRPIV